MHDMCKLFSPEYEKGYFIRHDWPLWHGTQKDRFEEFIRYSQALDIPKSLKFLNVLSLICWLFFDVSIVYYFLIQRKRKR